MKLSLIAVALCLCSCAVGSTAEGVDEPVVVPVQQIPTPKAPTIPDEPQGDPQCVVDAHWEGNCYVVAIYCKDKYPRVEVSCGPGRPLWPWEIIPDPPYESNRK